MPIRRFALSVCTLLLLLSQAPVTSLPGVAAPAFASPQFETVWARADRPVAGGQAARSWLWGPQPGETRQEPFAGAPGGTRLVQYFDKARMEANPGADPASQWAVTTGLLTVELVSGKIQTGPDSWESRAPAEVPVAGDAAPDGTGNSPTYRSFVGVASLPGGPDRKAVSATGSAVTATIDRAGTVGSGPEGGVRYSRYAPETGHNIPDVFDRFGQQQGPVSVNGNLQTGPLFDPLYVLGYPISEAYWATVPVDGKATRVLIQLYQRRVLTYIPSFPAAWQVQMGNVGQHYYTWRYTTPAPATPPPAPAAQPADTWVRVDGSHLTYGGQPVRLKGTNYWRAAQPFVGTWIYWKAPTMQQELAAAQAMGVNTIRIGIPYDQSDALDVIWGGGCDESGRGCDAIRGPVVERMTQLLQIAAGYKMKVIFTLFEWNNSFPAPDESGYARQMAYLRGIVAPFKDDDRVIAWDLHNEPENYASWNDGVAGPARVIAWVDRVAAETRRLDPHHLLTVGVAHYENLWLAPQGRSLLDIVDFASFHCYSAGTLRTQMDAIHAHTQKPVLLEEMGWPTGPEILNRWPNVYDEATQQFLYRTMLGDAQAGDLAGVVQWALYDNPRGNSQHYIKPTIESYFGLVRLDGSWKPAAADFRDRYQTVLLPSTTHTELPLTSQ